MKRQAGRLLTGAVSATAAAVFLVAFKENPRGTFADHNPRVSCDRYSPDL